jgi:hypothetical protein
VGKVGRSKIFSLFEPSIVSHHTPQYGSVKEFLVETSKGSRGRNGGRGGILPPLLPLLPLLNRTVLPHPPHFLDFSLVRNPEEEFLNVYRQKPIYAKSKEQIRTW